MIRKDDLREAIAEMQGQKNPNAQTCIKLAAYYTILDHITEKEISPQIHDYSETLYSGTDANTINYDSGSDFAKYINGKSQSEIWPIMDDLMNTLSVINPKLYQSVLIKVAE